MYVLQITLPSPHVALRYADPNKIHPNFDYKDLQMWTPEIVTPVTIPVGSQHNLLTVQVTSGNYIFPGDEQWSITGSIAGSSISFASQSFVAGEDSTTFTVEITPVSLVVPWGIDAPISWTLNLNGIAHVDFANQTRLKIFAITKDIAPYYKTERIPVEFLELLVLPTLAANISSLRDWQQWVTNKCFGSTYDKEFQGKIVETYKDFTCIHSYRYDTYHGGQSFIYGGYQTIFDLDSWIQKRGKRDNGHFAKVNCYDQSGLLQAALALGTPFTLVDSSGSPVLEDGKKQQSFGRLWKSPFGFIPTADLIGWGSCDSPFFQEGQKTQLFGTQGETDPVAKGRTLFANHSYTYVRSTDGKADYLVLDACAGPADQLTGRETYGREHIDLIATFNAANLLAYVNLPDHAKWSDADKKRWTDYTIQHAGDAKPYNGIISTVSQPVIPKHIGTPISQKLLELFPGLKGPSSDSAKQTLCIPVSPEELLDGIIDSIPGYKGNEKNFEVERPDPSIGADGTSFDVDIYNNNQPGTAYVSISIDILTDFANAAIWAAEYLDTFDHPLSGVYDINSQQSGSNRFLLPPKSTRGESLLVLENILVTLSGTCGSGVISNFMTEIESKLQAVTKINQPESWDDHTVAFNNPVQIGSKFEVKITASGMADIDVQWEKGVSPILIISDITYVQIDSRLLKDLQYVISLQDPTRDPNDSSIWTMQCLAQGSTDAAPGDLQDSLHVSYAHLSTYYTMSRDYPITIKASSGQ
ncbi:hypothetical protein GLAREA_00005 [Glarea lozoyensis ATCC 20868]|uniref:Uncharacterized protein n=1 Tax=Glarea lozoyensis (strain ATCC 20868 / MF5171) TaxID=1116229 RepID=S3CQY7_GLAL2|nr:uncharacterized protein GLAREA_00005 [Glarea lozoyensis ATCC 20868]EPE28847.1 hypothetical protein GLAREA_00005 [Glarea lozoyensis ATCC 20868]